MPFEDSMKKVAAITWAPSGKKIAVGAADRVNISLFRLSTCSMIMETKKISSPPNLPIRDKRATLSEVSSSLLTLKRLLLLRATTSFLFIRSVYNGERRRQSVTNSLSLLR